jgi:hypothetical protein
VLAVLALATLIFTRDHWWKKSTLNVFYNGNLSKDSRVYSKDGAFLIVLSDEGQTPYVVYPERRIVGMANPSFVFVPGYAYSRTVPPVYARMDSVKIEVDPKLVTEQDAIEFNSFEHGRVYLRW